MQTTYVAYNFEIILEQFCEQVFGSQRLSKRPKLQLMATSFIRNTIDEDLYHMSKCKKPSKIDIVVNA